MEQPEHVIHVDPEIIAQMQALARDLDLTDDRAWELAAKLLLIAYRLKEPDALIVRSGGVEREIVILA